MVSIVMASTVDSDVVVICVDTLCELKQMQHGVSLWVASGQGTTITATTMAPYVINLEKKTCVALSIFHAFTGKRYNSCSVRHTGVLISYGEFFRTANHRRSLFELTEVFTCVLCKRSTKCAELNV